MSLDGIHPPRGLALGQAACWSSEINTPPGSRGTALRVFPAVKQPCSAVIFLGHTQLSNCGMGNIKPCLLSKMARAAVGPFPSGVKTEYVQ